MVPGQDNEEAHKIVIVNMTAASRKHGHGSVLHKKGRVAKAMQKIGNLADSVGFSIYFRVLSLVALAGQSEQLSDSPP